MVAVVHSGWSWVGWLVAAHKTVVEVYVLDVVLSFFGVGIYILTLL